MKTALELYQQESRERISFGCTNLDEISGGGLSRCGITEISGEAGSGKTQICLQLSARCCLPHEMGGVAGKTAYMSCGEGEFPVRRLSQIVTGCFDGSKDENMILQNIMIEQCYTVEDALDSLVSERSIVKMVLLNDLVFSIK